MRARFFKSGAFSKGSKKVPPECSKEVSGDPLVSSWGSLGLSWGPLGIQIGPLRDVSGVLGILCDPWRIHGICATEENMYC